MKVASFSSKTTNFNRQFSGQGLFLKDYNLLGFL